MRSILLVEDDENLRYGLQLAFQKDYKVYSASALNEAHYLMAQFLPDILLLDVCLPDGNGMAFCSEIRKVSNVPIILLTVRDMETDEVSGLLSGADDYITKPFSLAVLRARVDALLRRTEKREISVLVSRGFKIDLNNHKVYRDKAEIPLSYTEFKLLRYLMGNSGKVLAKEKIISAIWDNQGNFVEENALPVNISRLRAKLEKDPKNPQFIKTLHKIGYLWSEE